MATGLSSEETTTLIAKLEDESKVEGELPGREDGTILDRHPNGLVDDPPTVTDGDKDVAADAPKCADVVDSLLGVFVGTADPENIPKKELTVIDDPHKGKCLCGKDEEFAFMICCDFCMVWYHAACLQLTRTKADRIKTFACPRCISKDENLKIVYYPSKKEKMEVTRECAEKRDAAKKQRKEREGNTSSGRESRKSSKEESGSAIVGEGCNNCINCFRSTNCGKCANCEANKEPCLKRICVQPEYASKQKRKLAASTSSGTSSSKSGMPGRPRKDAVRLLTSTDDESSRCDGEKSGPSNGQNGQIASCSSAIAASSQAASNRPEKPEKGKRGRKKGWRKYKNGITNHKKQKSANSDGKRDLSFSDDDSSFDNSGTLTFEQRRRVASATYNGYGRRNGSNVIVKEIEERQCLGPQCRRSARPNSKYCSEDCGLKLAQLRLEFILPVQEEKFWKTTPVAAIRSKRELAALEEQFQFYVNEARALTLYRNDLENWIGTLADIEPLDDGDPSSGCELDYMLHCPVCADCFPGKQFMKHVERCFVRTEKQSCFGTATRSLANPQNIICEQFNKINSTYCKRLRVLCSEHYKPDLELRLKICGFPFSWKRNDFDGRRALERLFTSMVECKEFCSRSNNSCQLHHNWIRNTLGLIDVEQMNVLIRMDEIGDKMRWLQVNDRMRGDVLSLMCNETKCVDGASGEGNGSVGRMSPGIPSPTTPSPSPPRPSSSDEPVAFAQDGGGRIPQCKKDDLLVKELGAAGDYDEDEVYLVRDSGNEDSFLDSSEQYSKRQGMSEHVGQHYR